MQVANSEVNRGGRRAKEIEEIPAAEARKAEGASMVALLIPNPPELMGREAYSQLWSLRRMLQIDSRRHLRTLSKLARRGERKLGDVRRMYNTLGKDKALRRRQRAS